MAKIFLMTQGCSLNVADSETIRALLEEAGHNFQEIEEGADLVIINSCTVKSSPEQRVFHYIRKHSKRGLLDREQQNSNETKEENVRKLYATKLLITGCVPQADKNNEHFKNVSTLGPEALGNIVDVVEQTLRGKIVHDYARHDDDRLALPVKRKHKHIGILPINSGCLSACTYCKTKQARGHLHSYTEESIVNRFRTLVNEGVKEIWLTSQDTAVYGMDTGNSLAGLLRRLLEKEGDYRIRIGMANPKYLINQLDELIEILKDERVFTFLHIPVQAGSNKVLQDMKRMNTKEEFITICKKLTKELPNITIATDIIIGFPTETEEDFEETIALLEETKISVVNRSKFYSRPNTPAAKLKLLPTNIVKERSLRLQKVCERIARKHNKQAIGKEFSVLIDEEGKKEGTLTGRTNNYQPTILPDTIGKIGERVHVIITSAGTYDIRAL